MHDYRPPRWRPLSVFTAFPSPGLVWWWTYPDIPSRRQSIIELSTPLSPVRLSSVCNDRAPYSAGWNFHECFFAIWYLNKPLTFIENFTELFPGNPSVGGSGQLNTRGVAKYTDFWPIEGYIVCGPTSKYNRVSPVDWHYRLDDLEQIMDKNVNFVVMRRDMRFSWQRRKRRANVLGWVSSFLTAHQHIIGYSVP